MCLYAFSYTHIYIYIYIYICTMMVPEVSRDLHPSLGLEHGSPLAGWFNQLWADVFAVHARG